MLPPRKSDLHRALLCIPTASPEAFIASISRWPKRISLRPNHRRERRPLEALSSGLLLSSIKEDVAQASSSVLRPQYGLPAVEDFFWPGTVLLEGTNESGIGAQQRKASRCTYNVPSIPGQDNDAPVRRRIIAEVVTLI